MTQAGTTMVVKQRTHKVKRTVEVTEALDPKSTYFAECDPPLDQYIFVANNDRDAVSQVLAAIHGDPRNRQHKHLYVTVWRYAARVGLEMADREYAKVNRVTRPSPDYVFVDHLALDPDHRAVPRFGNGRTI